MNDNITLHSVSFYDGSENYERYCNHINKCEHSEDMECENCFCEQKISIGQELIYGNVKILDFCEKHMKKCHICKTFDIKYGVVKYQEEKFFCQSCFSDL